jgi:hypothetical protein
VLPALIALGLAAGTGFLLGLTSLGWAGLAGAAAGAISELALPYLVVPPLLGFTIWDVGVYGEYVPGVVAAGFAAILGTSLGSVRRADHTDDPSGRAGRTSCGSASGW